MSQKKISILYIDDEQGNVDSFKVAFRREYTIYTATSGKEGLELLETIQPHVIISDQKMASMTGVDFFATIKETYPKPIRILVTGQIEREVLIEALNRGSIFCYIDKPWKEDAVHNAVHNAYALYDVRQQLELKIIELEKTNEELNRFIYSTSHDLRSPLTSIMSVIELARATNDMQDPSGYLDMVEDCVLRVDTLIEKMIEYYKNLRADAEHIDNIDFTELINNSIQLLAAQNPALHFHVDIKQPTAFMGDTFRLNIIINNLISNAVKYQKPNAKDPAIWVDIKVDSKNATISIKDNGTGIPKEQLDNVFKMFFRYNSSVAGTGIGLFVVKEALQKLGGEITVQSTLSEGTTFKMVIPNKAKVTKTALKA